MFVLQCRFTLEEKSRMSCADKGAAQLGWRRGYGKDTWAQYTEVNLKAGSLRQRISDVLKRNFFALYCPREGASAENNSTDS